MKKYMWPCLIMGLLVGFAATGFAAPRAALFVQDRSQTPELSGKLDAFADMIAARLADDGFELVRTDDTLSSSVAASDPAIQQLVQVLQAVKSESTAGGPDESASALRLAQLMNTDYLVFASILTMGDNRVRNSSYGIEQESVVKVLRMGLRVLDGATGAQLYGDTVVATHQTRQNEFAQMLDGDQVNALLDQGAAELAQRAETAINRIAQQPVAAVQTVQVEITATPGNATVEVDGVVVGSTPGAFQLQPGVHTVRLTREGYATWERMVNITEGQTLAIPMELSAEGLARKGEAEAQQREDDIEREQSAADAALKHGQAGQASNSYIRLEGSPDVLSIGGGQNAHPDILNVITPK